MRIKFVKSFIVTLIPFILLASQTNPTTESFTADMIQKVDGQSIEGELFVKGNKYMIAMKEGGEEISIIVNRENGKTKLLIPSQEVGQEMSNTSLKSLSNNPFESFKYLFEKHPSRKKGSEVINGYECKKIEVYEKDQDLMTAWVSDKLNWPVKIVLKVEPSREVELKNIKEKPVVECLFQVPEDYKISKLTETKKEETKTKEKPEKVEDLTASKEAVFKKLAKEGIEKETEDGIIKLTKVESSALTEYFPGWHFFRVTREKEIQGGTSFAFVPVEKAAVGKNNKDVYILDSPGTSMPLNSGLKLLQDQNIKLNNEDEAKKLGNVLTTLYYKDSKVEGVESLGKNEWAIYNGTAFGQLKGFVVKVNNNGEITELNYKLKMKKK